LGVQPGDRVCILSENHPVFLELAIAAVRLGVIVATLNWRLTAKELAHCVGLVEPKVTLVSPHLKSRIETTDNCGTVLDIGPALDQRMAAARPLTQTIDADDPEQGLFIIYTSGTTGLPKGALLSRRAMLARLMVYVTDYGVDGSDTFLAWSPLFHMASVELGLGTLMLGGKVVILDGPDLPTICDYLESDSLSNLIFFPGMVEKVAGFFARAQAAGEAAEEIRRDGRPVLTAADCRHDVGTGRTLHQYIRQHRNRHAAGFGWTTCVR
jgi:fatty-acyl-CoA synthase